MKLEEGQIIETEKGCFVIDCGEPVPLDLVNPNIDTEEMLSNTMTLENAANQYGGYYAFIPVHISEKQQVQRNQHDKKSMVYFTVIGKTINECKREYALPSEIVLCVSLPKVRKGKP